MEKWLIKNRNVINIKELENEIGCPKNTLQNAVQGIRDIPKKWIEPLKKYRKDNLCL